MSNTFPFTVRVTDSQNRVALSAQSIRFWPTLVAEMLFNGADGSTAITESTGRVVSRFGNAQLKTDAGLAGFAPFEGSASLRLDGAGDYLTLPHDPVFDATGDFRVEVALRPSVQNKLMVIVQKRKASGGSNGWSWVMNADGVMQLLVWANDGSTVVVNHVGATIVGADEWADVALEKVGSLWRMEVGGVTDAAVVQTGVPGVNTDPLRLGRDNNFTTRDFHGNMDRFRFLRP